MKKIALATALSFAATSAFAGALTDPIVEQDVIIKEAAASSDHGILVPIMFLIMLAVSLNSGDIRG